MTYPNIKVQTPLEIIAKKLKYRSIITVRDFVDFAMVQTKEELLTKLKFENIVDIDRYLEMVEQFNDFNEIAFDKELLYLSAPNFTQKSDLHQTINNIMKPSEIIEVALDASGEVVAFDHFIPVYRDFYEELGDYMIYTLSRTRVLSYLNKTDIDYNDILILRDNDIKLIKD